MTNIEFTDFCRAAAEIPTKYMWGDYGRPITAATIAAKARQYPARYTEARKAELTKNIGTHAGCDCTGLIKWFLWTDGDIAQRPGYTAETDKSAIGWYNSAKVRGEISTMPEIPGLILYLPGHCGVYLGNGKVSECTLGRYGDGVVITDFKGRGWTKWCECAWIDYTSADLPITAPYRFTNGKTRANAYADEAQSVRIGSLDPGETCACFGSEGGRALVLYSAGVTRKTGWVNASQGEIIE